ncbi:MAG TPA: Do family serine endopeptidase [Candidatus Acidoferrales bacterium]|nr:Do family serine endopeptidase [Candidatus Acidoferrales bacterium]
MGVQFRELVSWVRHRKIFAGVLVGLTLGIGIMIGTLIPGHVAATRSAGGGSGAAMIAVPDPVNLSNGFSTIVAHVEPAVVNISTTEVFDAPKETPGRHGQDSFQDFFNKFFKQDPGAQGPESEKSLGSGVIVDKKGYVLTNDHVIDGATKIQVAVDGDPTTYTAHVVGIDKQTDLAVIKIDAGRPLPTAPLGNSDGVKVGDWVLAFGSPFSLNGTVTAGIVSTKDRTGSSIGSSQFQNFIQTDAAINPGNSGGPLVNLAGEVIGINTAIYTGSRGFEGVGFALPSNTAIGVYNQLVTTGRVVRGSIGIRFQEDQVHDPLLHQQLGAPYGVVVEYVTPGGPAAKAGIQAGDVITQIDGRPIHAGADLINPVVATPIGHPVDLTFMHNRKTVNAQVAVADMSKVFPDDPGNAQPVSDQAESPLQSAPTSLGLHVEALTPEVLQHLRMSVTQTGVIVTGVDPASFAEDIKLVQFDVIVEINHAPITNIQDYKRAIAKLKPGEDVLFKVIHPDGTGQQYTMFHVGKIPQPGN